VLWFYDEQTGDRLDVLARQNVEKLIKAREDTAKGASAGPPKEPALSPVAKFKARAKFVKMERGLGAIKGNLRATKFAKLAHDMMALCKSTFATKPAKAKPPGG
jgi:hypothetical protein